jgi:competence ComEA-like helix-hairpin-helix protein
LNGFRSSSLVSRVALRAAGAEAPARQRTWICGAIVASAIGLTVSAESPSPGRQADSKSQQVFATVCGRCHPLERVTAARRSRSQWEEVISTMISARNAQVSDEEFDIVLNYLVKAHGRVDVNRAAAADLEEVLEVPEKVAAAIVAYRKEHGRFEDFDALAKVPGVDREQLEKKRDAISF